MCVYVRMQQVCLIGHHVSWAMYVAADSHIWQYVCQYVCERVLYSVHACMCKVS